MSSKFLNSHRFLKIIEDGFVDMTIIAEQFSYLLGWKSINNEWGNWSDHGHIQSNVWKKATAAHTHWPGNRKAKTADKNSQVLHQTIQLIKLINVEVYQASAGLEI